MDCKDRLGVVFIGCWSSTDLYGCDLLKVDPLQIYTVMIYWRLDTFVQPFFSFFLAHP